MKLSSLLNPKPIKCGLAARTKDEALVEMLELLSTQGHRSVQEDEPLLEMAVKLSQAAARGACGLRGRRLVGSVTPGEILKKISGCR